MSSKVGSLYFTLGINATDFEKKLSAASARLADFGRKAEQVGRQLSMSLSLPMAAIGGASAKLAMDFESSMAKIEGLVGIAGDEVQRMGETTREMSKQVGKSANEGAEALFFITSAGLRGSDAMETLEASLKASAIGLGETKTVADLATSALNAYGSANLSAVEATDILVAAVREGKLEANELAMSMGRVLPIASAMGVSFNEVGAAFAALSRTGTHAAEAATQIRGILSALLNPTGLAAKELEKLGLSGQLIRDTIEKDGLLVALEMLTEKFKGNDEAAGIVFGNIRALSGVLDLFGSNVDTTRQIFQNMTNASGSLADAFAVTEQTAKFKLNKAIAESKDGMVELGMAIIVTLTPALEALTEGIQRVSAWFGQLDPSVKKMIVGIGLLGIAIGPVIFALGKIATLLAVINPVVAAVIATAAALATAYATSENFRKSISQMGTALLNIARELGNVLNTIFGPVLRLIGLGGEFSATWRSALGFFLGVLNAVMGKLTALAGVVSNVIRSIDKAFKGEFRESARALSMAFQSALDYVNPAQLAKDFTKAYNDAIGKETISMPQTGIGKGSKVYAAMKGTGAESAGLAAVPVIAKEAKNAMEDLFAAVNKNDVFARVADDIRGKLITAVDALVNPFSKIDNILTSVGEKVDVFDGMADKVKAAFDPLKQLFESLKDVGNETQNLLTLLTDEVGVFLGTFLSGIQGLAAGLGEALAGSSNGFKAWAKQIINALAAAAAAALIAQGALTGIGLVGALAGIGLLQGVFNQLLGQSQGGGSVPRFAKGGAVTGPTLALVGENPASRGEAIIPFERMGSFLNQFTGMGMGTQNIIVSGQIAGDVIRLSGQKSEINNNRVRWNR